MGTQPAPLQPAPTPRVASRRQRLAHWVGARPASLASVAVGLASFVVVVATLPSFWARPVWWHSAPGLTLSVGLTALALTRRELPRGLAWIGVGFAVMASLLGWFAIAALMLLGFAIAIGLVSALM